MKNELKYIDIKNIIIFENENYFIINKPSHLSSLNERFDNQAQSILSLSKKYCSEAQLCHRLDKETSGAMLIAKNNIAFKNAALQFENREVKKVYHAIVDGLFDFDNFKIDLPILVDGKKRVKIDLREGKKATTIFTTLKQWRHFTLLQCEPLTGRMHQIRIHLSSQNAHIVADTMYGSTLPLLSSFKKKIQDF